MPKRREGQRRISWRAPYRGAGGIRRTPLWPKERLGRQCGLPTAGFALKVLEDCRHLPPPRPRSGDGGSGDGRRVRAILYVSFTSPIVSSRRVGTARRRVSIGDCVTSDLPSRPAAPRNHLPLSVADRTRQRQWALESARLVGQRHCEATCWRSRRIATDRPTNRATSSTIWRESGRRSITLG